MQRKRNPRRKSTCFRVEMLRKMLRKVVFQGGGDRSCDKGVHSEAVTNDRVKCGSRSCDQGVVGGENTTNDRVRSWMCAVQRWIM